MVHSRMPTDPNVIHPWGPWPDGALAPNSGPTLTLPQEAQGCSGTQCREPRKAQDLALVSSVGWAGGSILHLSAFSPVFSLQHLFLSALGAYGGDPFETWSERSM